MTAAVDDNDGTVDGRQRQRWIDDGRRRREGRGEGAMVRAYRPPAIELYTSSRGGGGSPVWRQLSSGTTLVSSPEVALVLLLHAVRTHLAGRQQGDDERWRMTKSKKQQHIKGHGTTSSGGL